MSKVEITNDTELRPGDKIDIEIAKQFDLWSDVENYLIANKLASLEDNPAYDVTGWTYTDTGVIVHVTIKEFDPLEHPQYAGIITSGVIIAAILGISLIVFSVTTYKVVKEPAGKVLAGGVGLLMAAVAVVMLLKARRGRA